MSEQRVHVALASDRNYLQHAAVTIASLLVQWKRHAHTRKLTVHLLHEELTDADIALLMDLTHIVHFELRPLRIEDGFFSKWDILRWSHAAFYRLAIPSLLPKLSRLVYLDCDLLVCDDLAPLFDTDLQGNSIAAVHSKYRPEHNRMLSLPADFKYFNSGVLVLDLAAMRSGGDEQRFVDIRREYEAVLRYPDQDILNIAYQNEYTELPLKWNLLTSVYRNPPEENQHTQADCIEAIKHPGIVHFTGMHKPWKLRKTTHHPYGYYYWKFLALTPFARQNRLARFLKMLTTGRLKPPKKLVPWGPETLNRSIPID